MSELKDIQAFCDNKAEQENSICKDLKTLNSLSSDILRRFETLKASPKFIKISYKDFSNGVEENKEFYVSDRKFKIDSTTWLTINVKGHRVKINSEKDIIEFSDGEQLFTLNAAVRELKKQGMRLPESFEFSQIIKSELGNKLKENLPGYSISNENGPFSISKKGEYSGFWVISEQTVVIFDKSIGGFVTDDLDKSGPIYMYSVWGILDKKPQK